MGRAAFLIAIAAAVSLVASDFVTYTEADLCPSGLDADGGCTLAASLSLNCTSHVAPFSPSPTPSASATSSSSETASVSTTGTSTPSWTPSASQTASPTSSTSLAPSVSVSASLVASVSPSPPSAATLSSSPGTSSTPSVVVSPAAQRRVVEVARSSATPAPVAPGGDFPFENPPVCLVKLTAATGLTLIGGSVLSCAPSPGCELWIDLVGRLELTEGTALLASTVNITARNASVGAGALISTTGLGPLLGAGSPSRPGNGGSFGGGGGQTPCGTGDSPPRRLNEYSVPLSTCCDGQGAFLSVNGSLGAFSDILTRNAWPAAYGSGGGPDWSAGAGGGRIAIQTEGEVAIDGTVAANGAAANASAATHAGVVFGAGSGGTVWIRSGALAGSGTVSAVGGHAAGNGLWAAGGGGRMGLHFRHLSSSLNFLVHGGSLAPPITAPGPPACYNGAAGTIFMSAPGDEDPDGGSARYNQLRVSNGNTVAYAVTLLDVDSSSAAPRTPAAMSLPLATEDNAALSPSEEAAVAAAAAADGPALAEAPVDAVLITNAATVTTLQLRLRTVYSSLQALRLACESRGVTGEARTLRLSWFSEHTLQARHRRRRDYCAAFAGAPTAVSGDDILASSDDSDTGSMIAADCSVLGGDETRDVAFGVVGVVVNSGGTLLPLVQDTRFFTGDPALAATNAAAIGEGQPLLGGLLVRGSLSANITVVAAEIELGNGGLARPGTAAVLLYADNITIAATCSVAFTGVFSARANNSMVMELNSAPGERVDLDGYDTTRAAPAGDLLNRRLLHSNRGRPALQRLLAAPSPPSATMGSVTPKSAANARSLQPVIPIVAREIAWWAGHSLIVGASCDIRANLVELASSNGELSIAGRIVSELPASVMTRWCGVLGVVREGCGELHWDAATSPVPPPSNFTAVLLAPRSVVVDIEGEVIGHALAACSAHIAVQNVVNATGMGCPGGAGPGAGAPGSSSGGGGGHGGDGGQSIEGARGGLAYGDPNFPWLLGSGGGSAQPSGGGAGGGYVSLHAFLDVTIEDKAVVGADAEIISGSTALPGGGGSGGAVLINTAMLAGSGAISAQGGEGKGGGGGGGGGRFSLIDVSTDPGGGGYNPTGVLAAASHVQLSRQWGWLFASGVLGRVDAQDIDASLVASSISTAERRLRGADVTATEPVASSTNAGVATAGDASAALSVASRPRARRLRAIAQDFTGPIHLGGGPGSPGAGGGTNGSIEAPACPPGYGGIPQCVPCGEGYWRNGTAGATIFCAACGNAPARAEYTDPLATSETCAYVCPAGYLYPSCLTPLEELLARFGGPAGFAGAMAGLLAALLVVLLLICRRRRLRLLAELTRGDGSLGLAKLYGIGAGASGGAAVAGAGVPGLWSGLGAGEDAATEGQKLSLLTHADGRSPLKRGGVTAGGYGSVVGQGAGGARFGTGAFGSAARGLGIHTALAVLGVPDSSARGDEEAVLAASAAAAADADADGDAMASAIAAAAGGGKADLVGSTSLPSRTAGAISDSADALLGPLPPLRASSSRESVELVMAHAALQERDLPRLAARIYLGGANTFGSPWMLPPMPPPAAAHLVHKARYAALARRLNASLAWPRWGWEEWACLFLSLIATPASVLLHKWRKRVRVLRLMHVLLAPRRSHAWLKDARAVALQDSIRIGVSGDCALAFIDLLHPPDDASGAMNTGTAKSASGSGSRAIERPLSSTGGATPARGGLRTPLALLLAGDGTLSSPCFLDPNDIAVRSVPTLPGVTRFIDSDWIDFVAEFNVRARCIAAGAAIQTAGPVLAFLRGVNLDPELLGGLRVELVRFWPCAQASLAAGGDDDDDDIQVRASLPASSTTAGVVAGAGSASRGKHAGVSSSASFKTTVIGSNRQSLRMPDPSASGKSSSKTARAAASAPALTSLRTAALLEAPSSQRRTGRRKVDSGSGASSDSGSGGESESGALSGNVEAGLTESAAGERSFEQCLRRGSFGAHSFSSGGSGSDSESEVRAGFASHAGASSSSRPGASSAKPSASRAASFKSSAMHTSRAFALGFEIGGSSEAGSDDVKRAQTASSVAPAKESKKGAASHSRRSRRGSSNGSVSGSDGPDAGAGVRSGSIKGPRSNASGSSATKRYASTAGGAASFQHGGRSGVEDSLPVASSHAASAPAQEAEWQWTNALRQGWKAGWRATFTSLSDDVVASGDAKLGLLITLVTDGAQSGVNAGEAQATRVDAEADAAPTGTAVSTSAASSAPTGSSASASVKAASPVLSPKNAASSASATALASVGGSGAGSGLAIPSRRSSRIGSSRGLSAIGAGVSSSAAGLASSAPRSFSRLGSLAGSGDGAASGASGIGGAGNNNGSSRGLITVGSAFASGASSSFVDMDSGTFQLAIGADGGVAMVGSLGAMPERSVGPNNLLFGPGPSPSVAGSDNAAQTSSSVAPASAPAPGSLRAALMSPAAAATSARRSFLSPASGSAASAAGGGTPGSGRPGSFAAAGRGISGTGMSFSLHDRHGHGHGDAGGLGFGGMSFSLDDDSLLPGLGGLGATFVEEKEDDAATSVDAAADTTGAAAALPPPLAGGTTAIAAGEPPASKSKQGKGKRKKAEADEGDEKKGSSRRQAGMPGDATTADASASTLGAAHRSHSQSARPSAQERDAPSSNSRSKVPQDDRPRSSSRLTPAEAQFQAQNRKSKSRSHEQEASRRRRHALGPVVMHERSAAGLAARLQTASAAAAGHDGLTGRLCCLPEALCDAASDVLTLATIDIGGHDDALRRRLDMSLPLPGVRIPSSSAPLDLLLDSAGPIAADTALDAVAGAALEQLQARAAAMSAARADAPLMSGVRAGSAAGGGHGAGGDAASGIGGGSDLGWLDGGDALAIPLSAAASGYAAPNKGSHGAPANRALSIAASGPVPLLRGLSRQLSIGMGGAAVRTSIAEDALLAPPGIGAASRASRSAGLGRGISALWGGPSSGSGSSSSGNPALFGSFEGVGTTGRRRALSGDDGAPGDGSGGGNGGAGNNHTGPIFAEDVSSLMRRVLLAAAGRAPALRRRILARVRQRTALTRSLSIAPGGGGGEPGIGLALVERHPSATGLTLGLGLGRSSSAAPLPASVAGAGGVGAYSPPGSGPMSPPHASALSLGAGGGSPSWEPLAPPVYGGAAASDKQSARLLPQDLAALLAAAERSDSSGDSDSGASDSDGDGDMQHPAASARDGGSIAGFSLAGYATGTAAARHSRSGRTGEGSRRSGGLARLGYAVPAPASLLWSAGIACLPAGWARCMCCRQQPSRSRIPDIGKLSHAHAPYASFGFDAAAAAAAAASTPRQSLRGRSGLCDGRGNGAAACFSRSLFVLGRAMQRTSLPPAPGRRIGYGLTAAVHILLLLAELALTLVLVSELWCVEPPDEAGGALHAAAPMLPPVVPQMPIAPQPVGPKATSCDYVPVSIYLTVPPGAFALPSFFGLLAVAGQSARGLRIYASWNGASVWSTAVALALVAANIRVLGAQLLAYPLALLALKALSAQCVPLQLAAIERLRGVRGWRGLFEVRNGPVERSSRLLKAAA